MAFHIRDEDTDTLVRKLARRKGVGLTEAVRLAVDAELARSAQDERSAKVREIQARIAARRQSGLKADKAFFDDLSGQGDD
ncbi:type II toxin-antitoxin system VapB family antitoxin [Phenylobacterium kunshanense]|uniref:Transcription factor n=1 Tax=Phenylobacterium kunshanense TaxID=1445034 RepID=A0A328B525_9CAUL|nr:type II toxin-antitoxin system VapB family antitoxin [Phenylobacterium kunshanense]RAK61969.1 transcription factor [Phenylobacterium kunshanense]